MANTGIVVTLSVEDETLLEAIAGTAADALSYGYKFNVTQMVTGSHSGLLDITIDTKENANWMRQFVDINTRAFDEDVRKDFPVPAVNGKNILSKGAYGAE